jgi:hypothetical protein
MEKPRKDMTKIDKRIASKTIHLRLDEGNVFI